MGDTKTFTQEEVNTIVQDRLAKEKAKFDKQIEEMQKDINRREARLKAQQALKEKGLPDELIDLVHLDSEEDMNTSLKLLETTYKKNIAGASRAEVSQPVGATPASAGNAPPEGTGEDAKIRNAMNL